jgi:hypothetical protein
MEDCVVDFNKEPYFINEWGVKWWFDSSFTKYAQKKGLNNLRVWAVQQNDGTRNYVITEQDGDYAEVIYEAKNIEQVYYHIDFLWLLVKKKR